MIDRASAQSGQNDDVAGSHPRPVLDAGVAETLRASPGIGGAWLAPGALLEGTYRVIELLGKGAMGAVYLVEHVALGKRFAAKVVAGTASLDAAAVQRLRNEARMASAIDHEHIVGVSHLGTTEDGHVFVVMELLRGEDLRARSVRQRERASEGQGERWLSDDEVRAVASPVISALEAAHGAGVVHRDLKPENIFLHERGGKIIPKIVDFGIGKLRSPDAGDLRLTATGQIVGTPLYMAPEQTRSTTLVDQRADIYAMGVMLFELLTGRLPFEASHIYEIVVKHATEPPPDPRSLRPGLPDAVADVLLRCLEKDPAARYQSAAELLEAWELAWREHGPVPTLPALGLARPSGGSLPPTRSSGASSTAETMPGSSSPGGSAPRGSGPATPSGARSGPRTEARGSGSAPQAVPAMASGVIAGDPVAHVDAGASEPREAPAGAMRPLVVALVIALSVVGVGAGAAWWASPGPADEAGRPEPRRAPPEVESPPVATDDDGPPEVPEVEERPAVAVPTVLVRRIESMPAGAEVLRDGVVLGTTPLEVEVPPGGSVELEVRRRGYRPATETVSERSPETVEVRLSRRESPGAFPELAPR